MDELEATALSNADGWGFEEGPAVGEEISHGLGRGGREAIVQDFVESDQSAARVH